MSGRGGRGGRGRGGRGRGGGPSGIQVRGIDAETESELAASSSHVLTEPPPLYPGVANLPQPINVSAFDRRLIGKSSLLRRRSRSSEYYIQPETVISGAKGTVNHILVDRYYNAVTKLVLFVYFRL
jgi:hypothetical protein